MFQELLKNKKFQSIIAKFYKENRQEILDIVLFGSAAKGKDSPKDIDLLLLLKNKEDIELAYALKKSLAELMMDFSITTKTYSSLMMPGFLAREAFLSEGFSLISGKKIAGCLGYKNFILFKYSLKGFSNSQRMRFQYSLHGRDKRKGMLKELSLIKFSDQILLSPTENSELAKEYLLSWRIIFEEIPILIPSRLA